MKNVKESIGLVASCLAIGLLNLLNCGFPAQWILWVVLTLIALGFMAQQLPQEENIKTIALIWIISVPLVLYFDAGSKAPLLAGIPGLVILIRRRLELSSYLKLVGLVVVTLLFVWLLHIGIEAGSKSYSNHRYDEVYGSFFDSRRNNTAASVDLWFVAVLVSIKTIVFLIPWAIYYKKLLSPRGGENA